jgi:hypothetical protein
MSAFACSRVPESLCLTACTAGPDRLRVRSHGALQVPCHHLQQTRFGQRHVRLYNHASFCCLRARSFLWYLRTKSHVRYCSLRQPILSIVCYPTFRQLSLSLARSLFLSFLLFPLFLFFASLPFSALHCSCLIFFFFSSTLQVCRRNRTQT